MTSTSARRLLAMALLAGVGLLAWRLWRARQPAVPQRDPRAFTIYVLGGSTGLGVPYNPRADLGRLTSFLFDGKLNGRPIQVINLARPGRASSDVVDDADAIARTPHEPGSAVAFLYLGNNEFLRLDDRHDLSRATRQLCDEPLVTAAKRELLLRQYRGAVAQIMTRLRAAGVVPIASTAAVNLADWEPNRSVLADPGHAPEVQALLGEGDAARARGDHAAALARYASIMELEPCFAAAHKRAGDAWRAQGRPDQARAHYRKAADCDGNPQRETSEQTEMLRQEAAKLDLPLVDAIDVLERASPDGLIGFNLMWDNCHPTLEGYLLVAQEFAVRLEELFGATRARPHPSLAELQAALGIDAAFLAGAHANRGQYCYVSATLTWEPAARLARAEQYLQEALRQDPRNADTLSSLAVVASMRGDLPQSLQRWRAAFALDASTARQRATNPRVRELLARAGIADLEAALER